MKLPALPRLLRTAWVFAMVATLIFWISDYVGGPPAKTLSGEGHLLAALVLVVLTFPIGLAWALVLNLFAYLTASTEHSDSFLDASFALAVWSGFFGLGYLQWFKLVPSLLRRWIGRDAP
jgi:hypothetical protein